VQGILSGFIGAVTSISGAQGAPFGPLFWLTVVPGMLVTLAISAVIGWLSWWWMAHAMRPASA
jgi:ABC-type xylose transport system permease subunit